MQKVQIKAFAANVALLLAIYLGAWQGIVWIAWPLIGFVWVMCLVYLFALYGTPSSGESSSEPLPRWFTWLVDAVCIFMFLHVDWYYTATGYALSAILLEIIYRRRRYVAGK